MVDKSKQEIITLKGRIKMSVSSGTSVNGDDFFRAPLTVEETQKNGKVIENEFDSIMLIFWKKDFSANMQTTIARLKENETITVHGNLGGRDNGLLKVVDLETSDNEEDMFI